VEVVISWTVNRVLREYDEAEVVVMPECGNA
jgi:hypothetical protein